MGQFDGSSGFVINGGSFNEIHGDFNYLNNSQRTHIVDSYNSQSTSYHDSFNSKPTTMGDINNSTVSIDYSSSPARNRWGSPDNVNREYSDTPFMPGSPFSHSQARGPIPPHLPQQRPPPQQWASQPPPMSHQPPFDPFNQTPRGPHDFRPPSQDRAQFKQGTKMQKLEKLAAMAASHSDPQFTTSNSFNTTNKTWANSNNDYSNTTVNQKPRPNVPPSHGQEDSNAGPYRQDFPQNPPDGVHRSTTNPFQKYRDSAPQAQQPRPSNPQGDQDPRQYPRQYPQDDPPSNLQQQYEREPSVSPLRDDRPFQQATSDSKRRPVSQQDYNDNDQDRQYNSHQGRPSRREDPPFAHPVDDGRNNRPASQQQYTPADEGRQYDRRRDDYSPIQGEPRFQEVTGDSRNNSKPVSRRESPSEEDRRSRRRDSRSRSPPLQDEPFLNDYSPRSQQRVEPVISRPQPRRDSPALAEEPRASSKQRERDDMSAKTEKPTWTRSVPIRDDSLGGLSYVSDKPPTAQPIVITRVPSTEAISLNMARTTLRDEAPPSSTATGSPPRSQPQSAQQQQQPDLLDVPQRQQQPQDRRSQQLDAPPPATKPDLDLDEDEPVPADKVSGLLGDLRSGSRTDQIAAARSSTSVDIPEPSVEKPKKRNFLRKAFNRKNKGPK